MFNQNQPILALDVSGLSAFETDSFMICDNQFAGAVAGTFWLDGSTELTDGATFNVGGYDFQIDYAAGTGNDIVLTVVPEPGTFGTLALVAVAAILRRRRQMARG